jgi:hypothetical protein
MEFALHFRGDPRLAVLGAEDEVDQHRCKRLRHREFLMAKAPFQGYRFVLSL